MSEADALPPPAPGNPTLSTERAARLLEGAMTTPDDGPGHWQTMLWRPPTVEMLRAWVPEYEVERRVARGSSGWVYVARHRLLDRQVALKVLAPAADGPEADTAALRASEGRLIARLSHPNVLPVYDSRPLPDGQHLFVFQFAKGGSLRQRLGTGPLPRAEALNLAAGIAAGLAHAHAGGIIHRDLKPENILFNEDGTPMIGDFGSAVEPRPEEAPELYCGTTGTPHYRAPEQITAGPLTPAVDLYALGIILHEMLTGEVPVSPAPGAAAPVTSGPGLSPALRQLLSGLLQRDPALRDPDAAGLARRLRALLAGRARRRWFGLAACAGLTLTFGGTLLNRHLTKTTSPDQKEPSPVDATPAVQLAVLKVLADFRATENAGNWAAGNAFYADFVDYFKAGPISHADVASRRLASGAEYPFFRTILTEPVDFSPAPAPQVSATAIYWAVSTKRQGGFDIGVVTDRFLLKPSRGEPSLKIVSHQNRGIPKCGPAKRTAPWTKPPPPR